MQNRIYNIFCFIRYTLGTTVKAGEAQSTVILKPKIYLTLLVGTKKLHLVRPKVSSKIGSSSNPDCRALCICLSYCYCLIGSQQYSVLKDVVSGLFTSKKEKKKKERKKNKLIFSPTRALPIKRYSQYRTETHHTPHRFPAQPRERNPVYRVAT